MYRLLLITLSMIICWEDFSPYISKHDLEMFKDVETCEIIVTPLNIKYVYDTVGIFFLENIPNES